ncbi:MAG: proton-conducting transporter membrane subunit [Gemmatimonadaceae bacterium]|nr:proton-conducting transporter membrane subunit [Gemmatimonadaceae bacterium]
MTDLLLRISLGVAIITPLLCSVGLGLALLASQRWLREGEIARVIRAGLVASLVASLVVATTSLGFIGTPTRGEIDFGSWLTVGRYEIPLVLKVDGLAIAFSILAAALTALVGHFSRTYLHKEAGFARFFLLLGLFASGTQLVAFAGALDLFFAGWELIGISSALYIGFFYEREMPVRSSVRAFATYRLCDAGLLIAMVTTHELLGSTRLSALEGVHTLSPVAVTAIGALFLLSAMGKSAQLPFSGWLPRAMEGPTPSSALFYGAVSIHAGIYLLLRVAPVIHAAPLVAALGVVVGLSTAGYATIVARTHTDAKGALAHATLAQIGLILAELSLGLTTFALVHLVCHALLRAWQFLRAPNMISDAHAFGHHAGASHSRESDEHGAREVNMRDRLYAIALHRLRLDERIDVAVAPVLALARGLSAMELRVRHALSVGGKNS